LHCAHEIRDEVKAALVGIFDLCPLGLDAFFEGYDVIVSADALPYDDEQDGYDNYNGN
jgi:hypothetical protein